MAKNPSQRGGKADFADASPNSDTGTPANEWNWWGEAVRKGYDAVEQII